MGLSYRQTASAAGADVIAACSGGTVLSGTQSKSSLCVYEGSAGGALTVGGSDLDIESNQACVMYEIVPAAGSTWAAGNYVVRINVTTANSLITWTGTYVCRLNSSNVNQATIGSLTGQTTSFSTNGVKTHTVSGASQTPSAGDKIYIVCLFSSADKNQTFGITVNQLIDTPISSPIAGVGDIDGAATVGATSKIVLARAGVATGATTAIARGKDTGVHARTIAKITQLRPSVIFPWIANFFYPGRRYGEFGEAAGGITSGAGDADGAATVTATGRAVWAAIGAATGAATTEATGQTIWASAGDVDGEATVAGHGATIRPSVGDVDAAATAEATGRAIWAAVGSSTGEATVEAIAQPIHQAVGEVTGEATVEASGLATGIAAGAGDIDGAATVAATAQPIYRAVGTVTAAATVEATGANAAGESHPVVKITQLSPSGWPGQRYGDFTGRAAGVSTATGTISAAATVSATGQPVHQTVGGITGAVTVSGHGATIIPAVGEVTASATAEVASQEVSTISGVGEISGEATVAGTTRVIVQAVGSATGAATVEATAQPIAQAVGTVNAAVTVDGVGANAASPIREAVGSSTGAATAEAVAQIFAQAGGSSVAVSTVAAIAQIIAQAVGESVGEAIVDGVSIETAMILQRHYLGHTTRRNRAHGR